MYRNGSSVGREDVAMACGTEDECPTLQTLASRAMRAEMEGWDHYVRNQVAVTVKRGLIVPLGANASGAWEMELAVFLPRRARGPKRRRIVRADCTDSLCVRVCVDTVQRANASSCGDVDVLVRPGEAQLWSFVGDEYLSWWQNRDLVCSVWGEVRHLRAVVSSGRSPLGYVGQVLHATPEFEPEQRWLYPECDCDASADGVAAP